MAWGIRESDNGLVLLPIDDEHYENLCIFTRDMSAALPLKKQCENSIKLAPINYPGKSIIVTGTIQEGHGMQQLLGLGDINDDKAVAIFFDGDDIHDLSNFYSVMDAWCYETRPVIFFTKESTREHIKFTANSDGTISLNMNPEYVLGTCASEDEIWFVKRDSPYKFYFENLRRMLYPEEFEPQEDDKPEEEE